MINIKSIISEVAGISFEVRAWSNIIKNYINEKIPKPNYSYGYGYEYNSNRKPNNKIIPVSNIKTFSSDKFLHFENLDGSVISKVAYIFGYELDTLEDYDNDFPNIYDDVYHTLFRVSINTDGSITVIPAKGYYIRNYELLTPITESIIEYMSDEGELYGENGVESLYAIPLSDMNETFINNVKYKTTSPNNSVLELNGIDYPEAYENFPVDKWVITDSNRIEYDHWKSGYDDNGQYVVYLNIPLTYIDYSVLNHEIKHSYDDWNRMSKGAPPIRSGWEVKNIYTPDFEKLVLGGGKLNRLNTIIKNLYLSSKLETPAYLENVYDSPYHSYRDTAKSLINFKASDYLKKDGTADKTVLDDWEMLLSYDIPFFKKFRNVEDFLHKIQKHFNQRGNKILRKIDKMLYVHGKTPKNVTITKPNTNVNNFRYNIDDLPF